MITAFRGPIAAGLAFALAVLTVTLECEAQQEGSGTRNWIVFHSGEVIEVNESDSWYLVCNIDGRKIHVRSRSLPPLGESVDVFLWSPIPKKEESGEGREHMDEVWRGKLPKKESIFGVPEGCVFLGENQEGYSEYIRSRDGGIMVLIPEGKVKIGEDEPGKDYSPQKNVVLSQFLFDKCEVTWRQYRAFCSSEGRNLPNMPDWARDDFPVCNVTWSEAEAYTDWVSCELPTESRWERAARSDDGRPYPWGEDPYFAVNGKWRCNYDPGAGKGRDGFEYACQVGTHPEGSGPFGNMDLAGNVSEWCLDWYSKNSYESMRGVDPSGPSEGCEKVKRGGSWRETRYFLRSYMRNALNPNERRDDLGFRCSR